MISFQPMLSHHFQATFYFGLIPGIPRMPDPVDVVFTSISGLGRNLNVQSMKEGGRNVGSLHLPTQVTHQTISMSRGVMLKTPLTIFLALALERFNFFMVDIHIVAYDQGKPYMEWTVCDATPTSWSTSSLDANATQFLINTFSFVCRDIRTMGLYS